MSKRPFLDDATKLFTLLSELQRKDIAIAEIEIALARTFSAAYQEGWGDRTDEGFHNG